MNVPPKPNLAATYTKDSGMELTFLKYGSPKYDGIRAIGHNGMAYSRNGILIPNKTVQAYFANGDLDGFDGELISGPHDVDVFKRTSSVVRTIEGSSDWHFLVFDVVLNLVPFETRLVILLDRLHKMKSNARHKVSAVPQTIISQLSELDVFEQQCLAAGFEGVMLRNLLAPYKNGRATENSQDLLKVKRFKDSEATVLDWAPLIDKAGNVQSDKMGSLRVKDTSSYVEFYIGSGFTLAERFLYAVKPPIGAMLTYQFFEQGAYDKPRFPTFKGFRPHFDLPRL